LLTKCRGVAREYYVAVSYKYDRASDCFFIKIKKLAKNTQESPFLLTRLILPTP